MLIDTQLTMGLASDGTLTSIEHQLSGRTELVCPFCYAPLIAVRGHVNVHHFRHDGQTCRESALTSSVIPGWDHFSLSLPGGIIEELMAQESREWNPHHPRPGSMSARLERYGLLQDGYMGGSDLTDTALIVPGLLSLPRFEAWMRQKLEVRLAETRSLILEQRIHPTHLTIEATRQHSLFSSAIYLMKLFPARGQPFYKVGRTNRDPEVRLSEVAGAMSRLLQIKTTGKIIQIIPNAGYIEKYTLWKFRSYSLSLGNYSEYLNLTPAALRTLKSGLTRVYNTRAPFTSFQTLLTTEAGLKQIISTR